MRFLLDTNVWLDCYLPNRPLHDTARRFIARAIEADVELLASVGTVKDARYLLEAAVKDMIRANHKDEGQQITQEEALAAKEVARGYAENLLGLSEIVGADESDVWLARKFERLHPDFEDNLVAAAAQRAQADYLITNDQKFIRHCPVAALDVKDALALLEP